MIPVFISMRGVIIITLIISGVAIYLISNNSKEKQEYDKSTGVIEYFDLVYNNLPNRDEGDYRYLKIDTYPYIFEIYEPNSEPTENKIDDLKIGDTIDIYYYEISSTKNIGRNKFTQFIDKKGIPYFIRDGFQKQLGYVIIGLCILINIMSLIFWKMGKLRW